MGQLDFCFARALNMALLSYARPKIRVKGIPLFNIRIYRHAYSLGTG